MSRTFLLALLIYALVLVSLATLNPVVLSLSIPLAVYLLAGLWSAPRKLNLQVSRQVSTERIPEDMPVTITLSVTNAGPAIEEVFIEDPLPDSVQLVDGSNRRMLTFPSGKTLTWSYTIQGKRGYYGMPYVRVAARDLLGLVTLEEKIPTHGRLLILPAAPRLRRIVIRPRQTKVYSGTVPARLGGPGVEFFGVREYQNGDSMRWINWRATARHASAIFSNEFEQERVTDVGLILDGRTRTNDFSDGRSMFEYSVQVAASLADTFLNAGNRVGMLVYGRVIEWTIPGYGKVQREKIMHALSRAQTGETPAFSELIIPRRLFPRYSQMVLVSPMQAADLPVLVGLRSLGYQVLIISPNPVDFELHTLPRSESVQLAARIARLERRMLISRMQRAGIQIVDWDVAVPFEQIIQASLSRPPAWLRAIGWEGTG